MIFRKISWAPCRDSENRTLVNPKATEAAITSAGASRSREGPRPKSRRPGRKVVIVCRKPQAAQVPSLTTDAIKQGSGPRSSSAPSARTSMRRSRPQGSAEHAAEAGGHARHEQDAPVVRRRRPKASEGAGQAPAHLNGRAFASRRAPKSGWPECRSGSKGPSGAERGVGLMDHFDDQIVPALGPFPEKNDTPARERRPERAGRREGSGVPTEAQ
jgi:hypothetical protein